MHLTINYTGTIPITATNKVLRLVHNKPPGGASGATQGIDSNYSSGACVASAGSAQNTAERAYCVHNIPLATLRIRYAGASGVL